MKIKLNVRVNLTKEGRLFTVWPKFHKFLPGLEFYTGHGSSTSEAVEDLYAQLPKEFTIDDEFAVMSSSLEPTLVKPFEVVNSDTVRIFQIV
jgi:hypothetical protein